VYHIATTIQISEETKNKLFMIKNRLEKEWGRRVTYDEAIQFLLKEEGREFNRQEFVSNIRKYQGFLKPGEGKALLKELRMREYERDRSLS